MRRLTSPIAALAEFSVLPKRAKAFGKFRDLVSVTIPNVEFRGKATKEIGSPVYLQFSRTILTLRGTLNIPAEIKGKKLQPVANPENWHTQMRRYLCRAWEHWARKRSPDHPKE